MGSDGLWDLIENKETLEVANTHADPNQACYVLVRKAFQRWMQEDQYVDDTTVIIAHF